ncbi:hypothetical protein IW245_005137 [Longispora fulva]|uniref:Glycosyl transferase n=1 Tax=Longispora fulva TaxID=619741 RepID=A0A8J7GVC1_9ACTN|nr:hypothetical protein [Longispora fulva]
MGVNPADQTLIEWFLAQGSRFWLGDLTLVTDRMNSPDGINLLTNATNLLAGAVLAPVTFLFGAPTSFAALVAGNLAGTALGWYLLFARGFGLHRAASAAAGALCGFAPAMMSQSNSHTHITMQWLLPPIVYCLLRLTRAQTPIRTGLALGALITAQFFGGQEVLFFAAMTLGLFTVGYALFDRDLVRRAARPVLLGLGVAAGLAVTLLAYPLWVEFKGPQSVPNGPFSPEYFSADLASYAKFSPLSWAGRNGDGGNYAPNATEMNTFLGIPLLIMAAACVGYLWRHPAVRASAIVGVLMAWLSLGPTVIVSGEQTGFPALYGLLHGLPVIDGALPSRFALTLLPLIATVLALALDAALRAGGVVRYALPAATAVALLPLLPLPLDTVHRPVVPTFFSAGHWKTCVRTGGVLVPVPLPTPTDPEPLRWATAADVAFGVPEGFFIGPYGGEGKASIGVYPQPTAALLGEVRRTGVVPQVTAEGRRLAQADVGHWNASCITLGPTVHRDELKATLDLLYGPGERVADVWVWRVKP